MPAVVAAIPAAVQHILCLSKPSCPTVLLPALHLPQQQEALAFMCQRENSNGLPPFWEPRLAKEGGPLSYVSSVRGALGLVVHLVGQVVAKRFWLCAGVLCLVDCPACPEGCTDLAACHRAHASSGTHLAPPCTPLPCPPAHQLHRTAAARAAARRHPGGRHGAGQDAGGESVTNMNVSCGGACVGRAAPCRRDSCLLTT